MTTTEHDGISTTITQSGHDGAALAFIDTYDAFEGGDIRIHLNDHCIYFGNPETDSLPDAQRRAAEWEKAS